MPWPICNHRTKYLLHLVLSGLLLVTGLRALAADALPSKTLDDFSHPELWHAEGTDDISAALRPVADDHGRGLCLDFNFNGVSGGATLRRTLPISFPDNYALSFDLRGAMPANDLQVKLIDASGDNVWWFRREGFQPDSTWQTITADKRHIESAWGPAKDRTLRQTRTLEFTIYAGHGGKGDWCVSNLRLMSLPASSTNEPAVSASDSANSLFLQQAQHATRGTYPRGFSGEQSYWTLVGADGGAAHSALISEDGTAEVGKGGWSIEPMLIDGRKLIDWANVKTTQSLQDGYLPIPTVRWQAGQLGLATTLIADGSSDHSRLLLQYTVHNDGAQSRSLTLALLLRPFQVNPPTQFLNTPGGISPIHDLAWDGHAVQVNHALQVTPLQAPNAFIASSQVSSAFVEQLTSGKAPQVSNLHDAEGHAQGALLYRLTVPAHADVTLALVVPSEGMRFIPSTNAAAWLQSQHDRVAVEWREKLNRVALQLPPAQQAIVDTARSAQAQILMSRDGPALQPGTRSYGRSWIRDGAMMSEALLRSGHADAVGEFLRWYAPHQFNTGKVPCCVDARGSDPVPENDSQGELIFTIAEWWRYSHDSVGLNLLWPHVERSIAYMDHLRASERSAVNQKGDRRALYGLMPASISHEGYSAKPMHSYWDDFWSLIGYDDAAVLATGLGKLDEATRYAAARDQFRADLKAAILTSMQQHHIDYIPGAAELGDFDATSTTIALSPGHAMDWLPSALLAQTFQRYWQGFVTRRDGSQHWDDYTPYELRTVASFIRLGWRDRAQQLLTFFLADRRPAAWNQWAEVVGRDPRQPRFVGDMPHAWIASDFLRSVYDMFAYERIADQSLVLAAGLEPAWFAGRGVAIERLRTPWGLLSYSLHEQGGQLVLRIPAGQAMPPGGLVLPWPYPGEPVGAATLNGKPVHWHDNDIVIHGLPATLSVLRPGTDTSP